MTANEYLKSIQDNFDGIEKNLDKLSKKEIDTMLNALAEGEDFPEEQPVEPITDNELYASVQRELMRQNKRTPYDMKDIIDATKMALKENQPVKDELISRQAAIKAIYGLVDESREEYKENPHIDLIVETIEDLPSIHIGKWLRTCASGTLYCSECGKIPTIQRETAKCPNCGCRMEVSK